MSAATTDPLKDPGIRRSVAGQPLAALGASVGAMLVAVPLWAGIDYVFIRYTGMKLIGIEGALAGAMIGAPASYLARGQHLWLRIVAAVLAIAAGILGSILWMNWATGKSFEVLFSNQPLNNIQGQFTEYDATMNTLRSFGNVLGYLVAGGVAFWMAGIRRAVTKGPVPRCVNCSADLRNSLAQRHTHCPHCGTRIPDSFR